MCVEAKLVSVATCTGRGHAQHGVSVQLNHVTLAAVCDGAIAVRSPQLRSCLIAQEVGKIDHSGADDRVSAPGALLVVVLVVVGSSRWRAVTFGDISRAARQPRRPTATSPRSMCAGRETPGALISGWGGGRRHFVKDCSEGVCGGGGGSGRRDRM